MVGHGKLKSLEVKVGAESSSDSCEVTNLGLTKCTEGCGVYLKTEHCSKSENQLGSRRSIYRKRGPLRPPTTSVYSSGPIGSNQVVVPQSAFSAVTLWDC